MRWLTVARLGRRKSLVELWSVRWELGECTYRISLACPWPTPVHQPESLIIPIIWHFLWIPRDPRNSRLLAIGIPLWCVRDCANYVLYSLLLRFVSLLRRYSDQRVSQIGKVWLIIKVGKNCSSLLIRRIMIRCTKNKKWFIRFERLKIIAWNLSREIRVWKKNSLYSFIFFNIFRYIELAFYLYIHTFR